MFESRRKVDFTNVPFWACCSVRCKKRTALFDYVYNVYIQKVVGCVHASSLWMLANVSARQLFESTDFIVFDEPTSKCDHKHYCSVAEKFAILNFDCLCANCHRCWWCSCSSLVPFNGWILIMYMFRLLISLNNMYWLLIKVSGSGVVLQSRYSSNGTFIKFRVTKL